MKIQCSVCEEAEANVLCCADEAALCYACDEKVHAANKLASKHQRVSLSNSSSPMPKCDICQDTFGYFFCLEDRALLCRKCDVAIHSVNTYVSSHQRFLLTGVKVGLETAEHSSPSSSGTSQPTKKVLDTESRVFSRKDVQMSIAGQQNKGLPVQAAGVGDFVRTKVLFAGGSASGSIQQWLLEPTECSAPSSICKSQSSEKVWETESRPLSRKVAQMSSAGQHRKGLPVQVAGVYDFVPSKLPFAGGSASESIQQWQLDEIFGLTDLDQNKSYLDNVSSKADSGKLGDSDCSPIIRAPEIALDVDECLGQVPEAAWAVPEIPSPPTNSGLNWPKSYQHQMETAPAFVPDLCCSPMQNPCHYQPNGSSVKRRRQF